MKNHTHNVVAKLFPNPSVKKSKLRIFLDQWSKFLYLSLLNFVPYVPMCQRDWRAYVLTCQRVLVFTSSPANVPYVLTCSRDNVSCVLTCSRANVPCVLPCSPPNVPYVSTSPGAIVPKCSRPITSNNKSKFSITCFT